MCQVSERHEKELKLNQLVKSLMKRLALYDIKIHS